VIGRVRSERGAVPVELALSAGLLLIPITLVVLSLAPWVERQIVARVAAREAARLVVVADTYREGEALAIAAVEEIARNHGLEPSDLSLRLSGDLVRGGAITAHVTVRIPILVVPGVGAAAPPSVAWTTRHTEPVDLYRSIP
jgi:Flp pilus assembly protein TadG